MGESDLMVFDLAGAAALASRFSLAALELLDDRTELDRLLGEASRILATDERAMADDLDLVRRAVDQIAIDLTDRVRLYRTAFPTASEIDELTALISSWPGPPLDPARTRMVERRDRLVAEVTGARASAAEVIELLGSRGSLMGALAELARQDREVRVAEVMESQALNRAEATSRVVRLDAMVTALTRSGTPPEEALTTVAVADSLGLDLDAAIATASARSVRPIEVLAHTALARSLGLEPSELDSLDSLAEHFGVFDTASGTTPDDRVSRTDLVEVVRNPHRFAPSQVIAAEALVGDPELLARLDTAAANDEVLTSSAFGARDGGRGDGIISIDDLRAFLFKSQLSSRLGDYAAQIDVAADPGGHPDGFVSRADLETFMTRPDLPAEVRDAAGSMLEAGMFDRTWLEAHRDEVALGAAAIAGGAVIVVSAGTATPIAMAGWGAAAGAAAAGVTTAMINSTGDAADPLDDVLDNAARGSLVGFSVAGLAPSSQVVIAGESLKARLIAATAVTSEVASLTSAGAFDLVIPESAEDEVHSSADFVSALSGAVAAVHGSDPSVG